jgi:multiple antibiotic resistance protein
MATSSPERALAWNVLGRLTDPHMQSLAHAFFLVYAGLFPIVNPIGSAPLFLRLTRHLANDGRHALASRVALNSLILILASVFVGSQVLAFFGITLPILQIGGGLVVAYLGWTLLHAGEETTSERDDKVVERQSAVPPDSFYPLTMPLTVGPGSIAVAITLGSRRPSVSGLADFGLMSAGALAGVVAIAVSVFLCYRFADRLVGSLGPSGTNVVVRLSAFITFCIGIEIAWTGASVLLGMAKA